MIGRDYESGDLQMTKYFKNRHKKSDSNESRFLCCINQIILVVEARARGFPGGLQH